MAEVLDELSNEAAVQDGSGFVVRAQHAGRFGCLERGRSRSRNVPALAAAGICIQVVYGPGRLQAAFHGTRRVIRAPQIEDFHWSVAGGLIPSAWRFLTHRYRDILEFWFLPDRVNQV